jgi:hypothetical protein
MRVQKMRVLESASTLIKRKMRVPKTQIQLTGLRHARTEYANTENNGNKVFSHDNESTESASTKS